jgi:hypothetical protein
MNGKRGGRSERSGLPKGLYVGVWRSLSRGLT